jgi:hypothetical protein
MARVWGGIAEPVFLPCADAVRGVDPERKYARMRELKRRHDRASDGIRTAWRPTGQGAAGAPGAFRAPANHTYRRATIAIERPAAVGLCIA